VPSILNSTPHVVDAEIRCMRCLRSLKRMLG
jgi:hypothetical protein